MSLINVNAMEPSTGTDITLGASGDTITIPSGATFTQSGTMNASAITAGTLAIAQGGTGAATLATAGLVNTPAFMATMSGEQTLSNGVFTKLEFNSEIYDSGTTYDPSTNYRFTPAVAGKYFIFATVFGDSNADYLLSGFSGAIYKNGSAVYYSWMATEATRYLSKSLQAIIDLDADDYIECYGYMKQVSSATLKIESSDENCMFGGYRIAGV